MFSSPYGRALKIQAHKKAQIWGLNTDDEIYYSTMWLCNISSFLLFCSMMWNTLYIILSPDLKISS
jgi:hypothetical protein